MDNDIRIIYIEDFQYKNDIDKFNMSNHPLVGNVYRAFFIKESGKYEIYVGRENTSSNMDAILVDGLKTENPVYKCHAVEITDDNLTALDLDSENLSKINKWTQDENKDLINLKNNTITVDADKDSIVKEITIEDNTENTLTPQDIVNLIASSNPPSSEYEIYDNLEFIYDSEKEFHSSLTDLIAYIASTYEDKYADNKTPNISKSIIYSNHGRSITCWNAIKYLQRYLTVGFDKSGNKQDLYKAIHYILFEITRLNNNGKK